MNRSLRFAVVFVIALAGVPFLPLYIERTLLRSWRVDRLGDEIQWGWKICTLSGYWSNYNYFMREQRPGLWLKVNIALALLYALLFAVAIDQLSASRRRR